MTEAEPLVPPLQEGVVLFVSPERSSFLTGGYAGGAAGLRGKVRNSPAGAGWEVTPPSRAPFFTGGGTAGLSGRVSGAAPRPGKPAVPHLRGENRP